MDHHERRAHLDEVSLAECAGCCAKVDLEQSHQGIVADASAIDSRDDEQLPR